MQYRQVPSMDISFSAVGLGCWAFSGESVWDGYSEEQSIATIRQAIDAGITFFDVAPIYGHGQAETVLGRALKGIDRGSVTIATKCGLVWDSQYRVKNDLSPASIRREIDDSLRRLQTEYIDLYQMHWPDPSTPVEETMEALLRLREEGKIRYIGASNFSMELSLAAMKVGPIASQQGLYNMLERNASFYHELELTYRTEDEILPFCREHGQAFFPYSPLFQGLLTEGFKPFSERDIRNQNRKLKGDQLRRHLAVAEEVKRYCREVIGRSIHEVAINWLLHRREVTSVICGAQTPAHILANVRAVEWQLTDGQVQELNRIVERGLA